MVSTFPTGLGRSGGGGGEEEGDGSMIESGPGFGVNCISVSTEYK